MMEICQIYKYIYNFQSDIKGGHTSDECRVVAGAMVEGLVSTMSLIYMSILRIYELKFM